MEVATFCPLNQAIVEYMKTEQFQIFKKNIDLDYPQDTYKLETLIPQEYKYLTKIIQINEKLELVIFINNSGKYLNIYTRNRSYYSSFLILVASVLFFSYI